MYRQWDKLEHLPYVPPRRTDLPFETKRQPFLPRLLVSLDAKLCDAFLSGLRKDFLARHRDGDYAFREPPMTLGHWVAWPSEHVGEQTRESIDVAEWDLDQDGRKQLLLYKLREFRCDLLFRFSFSEAFLHPVRPNKDSGFQFSQTLQRRCNLSEMSDMKRLRIQRADGCDRLPPTFEMNIGRGKRGNSGPVVNNDPGHIAGEDSSFSG